MHHYFEAITNTSGDSLVGYFGRVINRANNNTVTLASDDNGTPIIVVSGVENMAKTDDFGNLDFYVEPGTYDLEIYAPNATSLIMRVPNVAMSSSKGDRGDPGPEGPQGEGLAEVMAPDGSALVGYKAAASTAVPLSVQQMFRGLSVTPEMFGAKGDGTVDDSAAINRAAAAIKATGRPGFLRWSQNATYRCDRTVTLDTLYVSTQGTAIFDFRNLTDNIGFDVISSNNINSNPAVYKVRRAHIGGMQMAGPARVGSKIAIRIGPQPSTDTYNTQFELCDFAINSFGNGVVFLEHVYCMEVRRFMMSGVDRCFYKGQGNDAGERIQIADGTMSACGTNFQLDDISADFYVSNVSSDYNEAPPGSVGICWVRCDSGLIRFHHCHFEANNANAPVGPDALFRMGSSNTAEISVTDSYILFALQKDGVYLFTNDNAEKPITFKRCFVFRVLGVNRTFGTGRAVCDFSYLNGGSDHTNALVTSRQENLNPDDFSGSAPIATNFSVILGGDGTRLPASSAVMSMTASGGRLRLIKKQGEGPGSPAQVVFVVPMHGSQAVAGLSYNLIKDGSLTGNFTTSMDWVIGYVNGAGIWVPDAHSVNIGTNTIQLTTPPGAAPVMIGAQNIRRPAWATHLLVSFLMTNVDATPANAGSIDIAQFLVTTSRGN